MRPVSAEFPVSQDFGSFATAGVNPNQYGTDVERLVYQYGNYQPFGHAGQDIACPIGTPVHAIADGTVLWADWGTNLPGDDSWSPSGYFARWALYKTFPGIVTVIQHDGWISVYAHLSEAPLNIGDRVTEGQQIALSGNTRSPGVSLGAHLHVEALVDLTYSTGNGLIYGRTDPTPYFGGIAAQASTITPLQEDTLALPADFENEWATMKQQMASLVDHAVTDDKLSAALAPLPVKVWSYTNPNIPGGDAFQRLRDIPANVLNQTFKLADGTVTNLAGILTAIHATPATGTPADPQTIVDAIVNGIQITRK